MATLATSRRGLSSQVVRGSATRPHEWGAWRPVEQLGDELALVERTCVASGCGADELASSDCLGPALWSVAPSSSCRGRGEAA